MDFADSGIPDEFRTLVVVPMMLVNAETVAAEVEKLEIRYLANKEANLLFSLFTDYTDAATLSHEDDSELLRTASVSLEALNQRHGERFFLFHRERTWTLLRSPSERLEENRKGSNDPVLDPAMEALYIRDEENGVYWSPTAAPIREESAYRARHGAGYSVFEHNRNGIEQELTVFVPVDENGGKPVKLQRLRLTNASGRRRRLSITDYVELALGETRESSQMHVMTTWDDEAQALLAHNRYHPEYAERVAFVVITPQARRHLLHARSGRVGGGGPGTGAQFSEGPGAGRGA